MGSEDNGKISRSDVFVCKIEPSDIRLVITEKFSDNCKTSLRSDVEFTHAVPSEIFKIEENLRNNTINIAMYPFKMPITVARQPLCGNK